MIEVERRDIFAAIPLALNARSDHPHRTAVRQGERCLAEPGEMLIALPLRVSEAMAMILERRCSSYRKDRRAAQQVAADEPGVVAIRPQPLRVNADAFRATLHASPLAFLDRRSRRHEERVPLGTRPVSAWPDDEALVGGDIGPPIAVLVDLVL